MSTKQDAAHAYWLANRFRHEYWTGRLAEHRNAIHRPGISFRHACWNEVLPVIQDVLLAEPLCRCVAYQATILEAEGIDEEFAPLAHSAMTAHIEARHRCLHLIVFGPGLPVDLAVHLNVLRRSMEFLSDSLLGMMRPVASLSKFAFDADYVANLQRERCSRTVAVNQLQATALGLWITQLDGLDIDSRIGNQEMNSRMAQVVQDLIAPEAFDALGLPLSLTAARIGADSRESTAQSALAESTLQNSPLDLFNAPPERPTTVETSDKRW